MGWLNLKKIEMKNGHIRKLMNLFSDYEELFLEKNFSLFKDDLKRELEKSRKIDIREEMDIYNRSKIRIISANDYEYPKNLREVSNFPLFLYVKGKKLIEGNVKKTANKEKTLFSTENEEKNYNFNRNIAVIGTRRMTKIGRNNCEKIVKELLDYDINLISGLAEGIDTIALKMAVENQNKVTAVVGSGLDVVYPYGNRELWEKISECGTLISEYPMGTKPLKWNFPQRNRIIAGLSEGILVAESFKSGGALITAELGFTLNREIFAIPGFLNYPSFEGCNNLIKENKAKLVTSADDIAKEFLWDLSKKNSKIEKLTEDEELVFRLLVEEMNIEEISKKLPEFPVKKLFSVLMSLKIKGLIVETGATKFLKIV